MFLNIDAIGNGDQRGAISEGPFAETPLRFAKGRKPVIA